MIFSLIDYIHYRYQTGRFDLKEGTDIMCSSWIGHLPKPVLSNLKPGSVILYSNFDWYISWLIMYFTNSQVSHVAVYAGNGMVLHTGFSGVKHEPIENTFGKKVRILPLLFHIDEKERKPFNQAILEGKENLPYPIALVLKKALYILSGRNGRFYALNLFLDSLVFISIVALVISHYSIGLSIGLFVIFVVTLCINLFLSKIKPLPVNEEFGAPCDALLLPKNKFSPFFNPESRWLERQLLNNLD